MIKSKNRKGWSKRFIKILGLKTTYLEDYIATENRLKRIQQNGDKDEIMDLYKECKKSLILNVIS